jgi:diguanylate cyclase (GGDEF)-like protein/PAS domain S-box-containing protein
MLNAPFTKYDVALAQFESAALHAKAIEPLQHRALADVRRVLDAGVAALYQLDGAATYPGLLLCDGQALEDVAITGADPQILETLAAGGTLAQSYAVGDAVAGLGTTRLTAAATGPRKPLAVLVAGTFSPDGFSAADRTFMSDLTDVLALAQQRAAKLASLAGVVDRYRQLFEGNPNPMCISDAGTSRYLDANQAAIDQYGYSREQLLTMSPYELRAPESRHEILALREIVARKGSVAFDTVHVTATGGRINVHVTVVSIDRNGRHIRVISVQNLTELHEALKRLRQSEADVARAQMLGKLGDWWYDTSVREHHWSDELFRIVGLAPGDGVPAGELPYRPFVHPDDLAGVDATVDAAIREHEPRGIDHRLVRSDGEPRYVHFEVYAEYGPDGGPTRLIGTVQDISRRKFAEAQLEHHAHFDRLTDLPNRALLSERLEAAIAKAVREGTQAAVLFIDVDQFKIVNDTMGHTAGDVMLTTIADRLRRNTRPTDCVARMGGDEFIAVLSDVDGEDHVAHLARNLGRVAAEPMRLHDRDVEASVSIGIAMFPEHGSDAETLIRNADTAMYEAKRAGRATARFFRSEMHDAATERMQTGSALRDAVRTSAFVLAYQPIFGRDGSLRASEALIRWPRAGGPDVQPGAFIPFAEECGLIVPIGTWVLRTACAQNATWYRLGMRLRVCVNISGKQLCEPGFANVVRAALHDSGLPPELLELEMTETVMSLDLKHTVAVLGELRATGVRIAIDDFGTGYNSLEVLRSLPVDTLKLDMCFVTDIAANPVDRAIAVGIIATAHSIGSQVVAEGIESAEQRAVLNAIGCDEGQGFLFSPGLAPARFTEKYAAFASATCRPENPLAA